MSGYITDIKGISVGHSTDSDALTGCTAVLFENGAVGGVDVRGSAPGTRETDLMRGYNAVERINAVMLCGGSAYGLDAASGAMKFIEERSRGVDVGVGVVPIVPAAVIFDLAIGRCDVRPDKASGYEACSNAVSGRFATGSVGVGTGATLGKAYGMQYASKSGVGTSCLELGNGIKVGAIIAVNALGDVYNPDTGKIVCGAAKDGKFLNCMNAAINAEFASTNTTIGVIATNARLTREEANKLASIGHDGLAMCIRPVHTANDGDTLFAMATCEKDGVPFASLMVGAVKAVCAAVLDAVSYRKGEK